MFDLNKENSIRIDDQSILLFKIQELSEHSKEIRTIPIFTSNVENRNKICKRQGRFNNLCVVDYKDPYAIPNLLLGKDKESSSMLRLTTMQLSLLVPRIRIFKLIYNSNLEKELQIELPFDEVANRDDLDKIFLNSQGRGSGIGIKSFKWKSMAFNQANISQFSANLILFAQNIEDLTDIRNSIVDPSTRKNFYCFSFGSSLSKARPKKFF